MPDPITVPTTMGVKSRRPRRRVRVLSEVTRAGRKCEPRLRARLLFAGERHHLESADRYALVAEEVDQQSSDIHLVTAVLVGRVGQRIRQLKCARAERPGGGGRAWRSCGRRWNCDDRLARPRQPPRASRALSKAADNFNVGKVAD